MPQDDKGKKPPEKGRPDDRFVPPEQDTIHGGWPEPESAVRGFRGSPTRDELRAKLRERPPVPPEGARGARQESFPEEPEMEYERSVIRIPFYIKSPGKGKAERRVDIMAFDAYMRLLREAPFRNGLGIRQFEFYIDAWELSNTRSQGLNADVTFTLSDVPQPKSLCVALQRESDYPAMIVYNAIYDVYVGSERVITQQAGTAIAKPVWEIPPRNVTVAFDKPFESDLFAFSAGTCEGMRSITRDEFERGASEGRRARGQK